MKKLLIFVMVLLFTATAFAQTDPVAYIIGAETQSANMTHPITVESILVQLNDDIDYTNYGTDPGQWTWEDVVADFSVLDGVTVLDVLTIESNHTNPALNLDGDNYFVLTFQNSELYGPDVDYLELYYLRGSVHIPTVQYGDLQTTTTAQPINDGIKPILLSYTLESNFTGNPYFAESGNTVTLDFESNENLASIPVSPTVVFSVDDADYSETVSAVIHPDHGGDQKFWQAVWTVPAGPVMNGKVNVTISFRDLRDNNNSLGPVDEGTDGLSVWLKNYDPINTYAGADFDPTTLPYDGTEWGEPAIYLWNSFNTIQEAIDALDEDATRGYVHVTEGTYVEDLVIDQTLTLTCSVCPDKKCSCIS